MLPIFPRFMFSGITLHCKAFKAPEGQKDRKYNRYFWGRVSKSNFRGEESSFWRMGWAMLDNMIRWKKISSAIAALDDFQAVTI